MCWSIYVLRLCWSLYVSRMYWTQGLQPQSLEGMRQVYIITQHLLFDVNKSEHVNGHGNSHESKM